MRELMTDFRYFDILSTRFVLTSQPSVIIQCSSLRWLIFVNQTHLKWLWMGIMDQNTRVKCDFTCLHVNMAAARVAGYQNQQMRNLQLLTLNNLGQQQARIQFFQSICFALHIIVGTLPVELLYFYRASFIIFCFNSRSCLCVSKDVFT